MIPRQLVCPLCRAGRATARRSYATEPIVERSGPVSAQGLDGSKARVNRPLIRGQGSKEAAPDDMLYTRRQKDYFSDSIPAMHPPVPDELSRSGKATYATWMAPPKRTDEVPAWATPRRDTRLWQWPEKEDRVVVARIRLHAYTTELSRLRCFSDFAQRASDALMIPTRRVKLPVEIAATSMNPGPFGQAKTKHYYWRRTHMTELVAYNASPSVLQSWFEYLKRTVMPGIGIRIDSISHHAFPIGEQTGKGGGARIAKA